MTIEVEMSLGTLTEFPYLARQLSWFRNRGHNRIYGSTGEASANELLMMNRVTQEELYWFRQVPYVHCSTDLVLF